MKTKITSLSLCFAIVDEEIHFMELKMLICISSMMWKEDVYTSVNAKCVWYSYLLCECECLSYESFLAMRSRMRYRCVLLVLRVWLCHDDSSEVFSSLVNKYCDEAIFETMWQHFVWTSMFWLGTTRWEIK